MDPKRQRIIGAAPCIGCGFVGAASAPALRVDCRAAVLPSCTLCEVAPQSGSHDELCAACYNAVSDSLPPDLLRAPILELLAPYLTLRDILSLRIVNKEAKGAAKMLPLADNITPMTPLALEDQLLRFPLTQRVAIAGGIRTVAMVPGGGHAFRKWDQNMPGSVFSWYAHPRRPNPGPPCKVKIWMHSAAVTLRPKGCTLVACSATGCVKNLCLRHGLGDVDGAYAPALPLDRGGGARIHGGHRHVRQYVLQWRVLRGPLLCRP